MNSPRRIRQVIIGELEQVKKKYALPRRTDIVYDHQTEELLTAEEEVPDYPVNLFLSREGYLKKITPQSLRMSSEQKYKDGDGPFLTSGRPPTGTSCWSLPTGSSATRPGSANLRTPRPACWGTTCPPSWPWTRRSGWSGPASPGTTAGQLLFFFDNGKAARVELSAYQTQTRRKKLTGAYSDKAPLVSAFLLEEDQEMAVYSTEGRCMIFHTASPHPQDHPHHPGGQRHDPQAQIPGGEGPAPGSDPHPSTPPATGPAPCPLREPCFGRRTGERSR